MFADQLKQLRKQRSMTQLQFAKEFNIAGGTIAMWETGKREPDFETAQRIANYFGVSVDYLLGSEQKEAPALTEKDERDIAKDVERIMSSLGSSGDLMFDGVPMSEEAKASMAAAMKLGLEAARLKNKETYTPKKYRKE